MLLTSANVRLAVQSDGNIHITTDNESYDQVRSILLAMKESMGLPVSLHSESVASVLLQMRQHKSSDGSIKILETVPPRTEDNEITILAWQINIRGGEKLHQLAAELADHFRNFGLTAKVMGE